MRALKIVGLLYSAAGVGTALALDRVLHRGASVKEPSIGIILMAAAGLLAWNVRMYLVAAEEYYPGGFLESYLLPLVATACFLICLIGMFCA